jgi:diguanylate cyclase (GGDEF)-like protein/PAS domain S-box-containing protein
MASFLSDGGSGNEGTLQNRRRRILVVDDDATSRLLMAAAFDEQGFLVTEAASGARAVELFPTVKPDLVVLDLLMPGLDGFDTCLELRRLAAHTPIVMLTGLHDIESINRAYKVGATEFATKPISWVLLGHRLRYVLRAAEALASVKRTTTRLEAAQRIAQLGYWEKDINSNEVHCSPQMRDILGTDPDKATVTWARFLSLVHPDDRHSFQEREGGVILSREPSGFDFRLVRPDGRVRFVRQETEVSLSERGRVVSLVGTLQDMTERREAEDRVRFLDHHDPLTGLKNRAHVTEWLERRMDRDRGTPLAVLCFDVDHFSRINESMGRRVGDLALQRFAERLLTEVNLFSQSTQIQGELTFAHLGGDKFLVAIEGLSRDEDVALVARGIQAAMRDPFVLEKSEIFVSVSAGLSMFPRDGETAEELIANAETASRHAKSQSLGSHRFFSLVENNRTAHSLQIGNELRRAIERNELRLHYQPQIDAVGQVLLGVEALVRWQHPERGLLAPSEFIDVAEDTGLIVPVGEWVLRTACEQIQGLRKTGVEPFTVAVNLSPRQIRDRELIPTISRILQRTGLEARYLDCEITETGLMGQALSEISVLHELKKLGTSISVDDFGTGYSSLSYLTRLPLDTLKIDKSFIADCTEKNASASIVRAIIAMAESLGLATIAEGVSTQAQADFLKENGCAFVQGYLFAKPMPIEALGPWIRKRSWVTKTAPSRRPSPALLRASAN